MTTASPKPAAKARRPLWKRLLVRAIKLCIIAYLGLCLVLALFQTKFIFPGAATQGRADAIVRPFQHSQIITLKARTGDRVVALFGPPLDEQGNIAPDADTRPTLLYFYGNGMCMADCEGEFLKFRHLGFNVMIPDFLGYGMSGGKPSEAGCYATADACYDYLLSRPGIDAGKIVPVGWSLGAASAVYLAEKRKTPCLVTVSAFTSMDAMAHHMFPYVPTSLLLQHHFNNEQRLRSIHCPIFIAHGTHDSIVPFAMSKQLAAAAAGPVTKYDVQDGDHNNVFDIGGETMMDAIGRFIDENTAR